MNINALTGELISNNELEKMITGVDGKKMRVDEIESCLKEIIDINDKGEKSMTIKLCAMTALRHLDSLKFMEEMEPK